MPYTLNDDDEDEEEDAFVRHNMLLLFRRIERLGETVMMVPTR